MVYLVPLVCLFVGGFAGFRLTVARKWRVLGGVWFVGLVAFGLSIFAGQQQQGWDGIGYVIVAALVLLPVIVGMVLGMGGAVLRMKVPAAR